MKNITINTTTINGTTFAYSWNLTEEEFERMQKDELNGGYEDFYGNLYMGGISFDIVGYTIDGEKTTTFVSGDCYVLYENTGYGCTKKGNIPYDFKDEYCITLPIPVNKSFKEWKKEVENNIFDAVLLSPYLIQKALIADACWD